MNLKIIEKSLNSIQARPSWGCQRVEKNTILNTVTYFWDFRNSLGCVEEIIITIDIVSRY